MRSAFFEGMRKPLVASQVMAEHQWDTVSASYIFNSVYKFYPYKCRGGQARYGDWLRTNGTTVSSRVRIPSPARPCISSSASEGPAIEMKGGGKSFTAEGPKSRPRPNGGDDGRGI